MSSHFRILYHTKWPVKIARNKVITHQNFIQWRAIVAMNYAEFFCLGCHKFDQTFFGQEKQGSPGKTLKFKGNLKAIIGKLLLIFNNCDSKLNRCANRRVTINFLRNPTKTIKTEIFLILSFPLEYQTNLRSSNTSALTLTYCFKAHVI